MKQKSIGLGILLTVILVALINVVYLKGDPMPEMLSLRPGDSYTEDWAKVDSMESKGRTESAMKLVDQIYEKAKADDNAAQVVKCLIYTSKFIGYKEEEPIIKTVNRFQEEIEKADYPLKPVLQSVLADIYFSYYQRYRWRFSNRTEVVDAKKNDLRTWDLKTIISEMVALYLASVENVDSLQRTPLSLLDDVLDLRENSKDYRPTLFDFLAHRAIGVFMNSQSDLPAPAYKFELRGQAFFASIEDFEGMKLESRDSLSFKFRGIKLVQELIRFHQKDKDPKALYDADLLRLAYVHSHSVENGKDELYIQALQRLYKRAGKHEMGGKIGFQLASFYNAQGGKYSPTEGPEYGDMAKKAWSLCEEIIKQFPGSQAAQNSEILKQTLLSRSVSITIEEVNYPNEPFRALVNYRNIDKLYFAAAKLSSADQLKYNELDYNEQLRFLKGLPRVREWTQEIPNSGDYNPHNVEVKIPAMAPGYYAILSGTSKDFTDQKQAVTATFTHVSEMAFFSKKSRKEVLDFYVVNRQTGKPLEGVKATLLERYYDNKSRSYKIKRLSDYKTDEEGHFRVGAPSIMRSRNYEVELNYKGDILHVNQYWYQNRFREYREDKEKTVTFFQDRAIYRPGQTIYFKGLFLERYKGNHTIVPNRPIEVRLLDVNYQEVAKLSLRSNEYGTFNGTFTAPTSGLTGNMRLVTDYGESSFSVEEYKRPKFEVKFDPVKVAARLGDDVKVIGGAVAYAGSNIDGAQVRYRVVRNASFPYWWGWGWGRRRPSSPEMEILSGTTETDSKGKFEVNFKAIPDASVPASSKPQFRYTVYADVIDINGETHSSQTVVNVGYVALNVSVNLQDALNRAEPVSGKLSTQNLNGEFSPATGKIVIQRLKAPGRIFRNRQWSRPDQFIMSQQEYYKDFPNDVYKDEDQYQNWEKGKQVLETSFDSEKADSFELKGLSRWEPGKYVLTLSTKDQYGTEVEVIKYFSVYATTGKGVPVPVAGWHFDLKSQAEPGEEAQFLLGTAAKELYALLLVEHKDRTVRKEWVTIKNGMEHFRLPVEEEFRGNFSYSLAYVMHGRGTTLARTIYVPWTNKKLKIEFETFRDKLQPGQKEEWRMKISGPGGDGVAAEMVAAMYDASLDVFRRNSWGLSLNPTWYNYSNFEMRGGFSYGSSIMWSKNLNESGSYQLQEYDRLNSFGFNTLYRRSYKDLTVVTGGVPAEFGDDMLLFAAEEAPEMDAAGSVEGRGNRGRMLKKESKSRVAASKPGAPRKQSSSTGNKREESKSGEKADLGGVKVRTNLNETAFFYPELRTDETGAVIVSFTVPEALTRWRIMALAHTKDLKTGYAENNLVTQKELMVMPNPPRFFRENDRITFSSKISNLSEQALSGRAVFEIEDALTGKRIDGAFGLGDANRSFTVKAGQSTVVSWDLKIPEGVQAVTWRVKAAAGSFSDGEQQALPILTNRMLVTESMPLPLRPRQSRTFTFDRLKNATSSTLKHHKLTLEFTSNPAWYAIQSLPYLMEYPYECTEQVFSRFYANSIASHVANSSPRIKQVFDAWKNRDKEALLSNLEKNQELKYLMLEETPWVLQAQDESERKKRVGLLFDLNRMANEMGRAKKKILQAQTGNGGFTWFPGMPDSRYITQHIVAGFGHLDRLGVLKAVADNKVENMLERAVSYLDDRIREDYERLLKYKVNLKENQLSYTAIHYLYARSYFTGQKVASNNEKAFNFYLGQAKKFWLDQSRYSQGMLALALHRFEEQSSAKEIIVSLKENALQDDEMGMYWKLPGGYFWYQAPIETQALLIEAFDEVAGDAAAVEEMKLWLLKQKQTQDWKTTKATTEACYALLLRGTDFLAESSLADITVGGEKLDPMKMEDVKVEAGTGYFKTSWMGADIKQEMGTVQVKNNNEVAAWGAMYWQYFEQLDKITFHNTNVKIQKGLFRQFDTPTGPKLEPVKAGMDLKPGDLCKARVVITTDRDLEYVHLKDMRGAGFEPVNVISRYKYQDGLGYYESTRDASTNFFISYLPKGTYVFEYPMRVQHSGDFSTGITTIQCMYAPEFTAHSEGIRVQVK